MNKLQKTLGTLSWILGIMFFLAMVVEPNWWRFSIGVILFIFGLASTSERRVRK